MMRSVLLVVVAVALAFDFQARGPYSIAYLAYAVLSDVWHGVAWHFYRV